MMDGTTDQIDLALNAGAGAGADAPVPDTIQLLPGGIFRGRDGRGPWRSADAGAIIAASALPLAIDVNHATDLAAPEGRPSEAVGWVRGLEQRPDGTIWGRVDWNSAGTALLADRRYRSISPVFRHDRAGTIVSLERASLTNRPNLHLEALNAAEGYPMADDQSKAAQAHTGGADTATATVDPAGIARLETALNAALGRIDALETALKAAKPAASPAAPASADGLSATVTALMAEVAGVRAREIARTVEGMIGAGRAFPRERATLIALASAAPEAFERELEERPVLHALATEVVTGRPPAGDAEVDPTRLAEEAVTLQHSLRERGVVISTSEAVTRVRDAKSRGKPAAGGNAP